jgi:hypothetical protein
MNPVFIHWDKKGEGIVTEYVAIEEKEGFRVYVGDATITIPWQKLRSIHDISFNISSKSATEKISGSTLICVSGYLKNYFKQGAYLDVDDFLLLLYFHCGMK